MITRFAGLCVFSILAVAVMVAGCQRKPPGESASGRTTTSSVILVTLDTTRADRLGCYGHAGAVTPTLDSLAAQGTRFKHAYAQVPLTLPSHCSIFTGKYPREHGIRGNGRAALATDGETLATIFRQRGHRTGAFVASCVLDRRYGLERGFETYNDDMGASGYDVETAQQPADIVTDRALEWLAGVAGAPFFCWIHYYDPHSPYEPPVEFRQRAAAPYDGEIAFMDSQLHRVIDWLDRAHLRERTLIVAVGDHGESLGEHGEAEHGIFLYDASLAVPLICVQPGVIPVGRVIETDVELVDLLPTLLELMGWPAPAGLSSRSLVPALHGELDARDCFAESLYCRDVYGWAEQRCIISSRWKYISSSRPELYDRRADPPELVDRSAAEPAVAKELRALLAEHHEALKPGQPKEVVPDAAGKRALESLGYLGGRAPQIDEEFLTAGRADPKEMLDVNTSFGRALRLIREARQAEAIPVLREIAVRSPESSEIRYKLGEALLKAGDIEAALPELEAAARLDPGNSEPLMCLGDAMMLRSRFDRAVDFFNAALALREKDAEVRAKLARAYRALGRSDDAMAAFTRSLQDDPNDAQAQADLGALLLSANRAAEAISHLRAAVRLNPELGPALNHLGIALARQGEAAEAKDAFRRATKIPAVAAEAYYNLGVTAAKEERPAEAVAAYEQAVAVNPAYARAVEALAGIYLAEQRTADAIRVLGVGAAASPDEPKLVNSLAWLLATARDDKLRDGKRALELARHVDELSRHGHPAVLRTLAAAYAETGDFGQAVATAQQALALATAAGQKDLAELLQKQLAEYTASRPWREAP